MNDLFLIDLQARFQTKSVDKKVIKSTNKATSTVVTNFSISTRSSTRASMIAFVCLNFLIFPGIQLPEGDNFCED